MGWWTTNRAGDSFVAEPGQDMVWGDGPADVMDGALVRIVAEFERAWGRKPTGEELIAGLRFGMPGHEIEGGQA